MQFRALIAAPLLTVAMLSVAACSGGDPKDEPTPTSPSSSSSPSTPSAPSTQPGGPPVGWEDSYTADELSAYETAVARWKRYNELTEPIYKAGKNTEKAREVIREYELQWQRAVNDLARYYDEGGLRNEVPPSPLWTQATSVALNPDGTGTVVFEQCTDYRNVVVTKNGKPADGVVPEHSVTPLSVHMVKAKDHDWKVAELKLEDKTSCAG